jgi:hypothetical protein
VSDAFDAIFYPGSKRKRRGTPEPTAPVADWELMESKKSYVIGGRSVHLYRISALAEAVSKSEITIRSWMRTGYLPSDSPIRLTAADSDDGLKRGAHRLFTKEMIQATVDAFDKRGLLGAPRIEWSLHPELPKEILAAWRRLAKEAFTPAVPAKHN